MSGGLKHRLVWLDTPWRRNGVDDYKHLLPYILEEVLARLEIP